MLMIMSKVEAVNIILSAIGGAPVDTLDDSDDVDVDNILRLIDRVSRDIQLKGWDFNTCSLVLTPDALSHKIMWNDSILKFTSSDGHTYAKRGAYLFDMTDGTFVFDNSITLQVIMAVDFEDLPQTFANYVTAKAALEFQTRYMGDGDVSQDLVRELQETEQELVTYDLSMGNYNMLNVTGVAAALNRT